MRKEKIIIPNKKLLDRKIGVMIKDGADRLHVLSDFDKTITKAFSRGRQVATLISVLRSEKYLTPDYPTKAYALFDKYHPIEINPKVDIKTKKRKMQEWWMAHLELLVNSGLNRNDINKAVQSRKITLRKNFSETIEIIDKHKIPFVIISSNGLGAESINLYLENNKIFSKEIFVISNNFIWNKSGRAVGFKKPIIHVLNKDETSVHKFPVYKKIKNRENILLLGDGLGDVGMTAGFQYKNIIKIGFLNEGEKANLHLFKKHYDIIITNDGSFAEVKKILTKIITSHGNNKKL